MAFRMATGAWFDAPSFQTLSYPARNLYLALYYSPEAIGLLPGVFRGGLAIMSEAARMPLQEAQQALTELVDRHIVEHDQASRMTIFLDLGPFARDRPANPNHIKSCWSTWCDLPPCDLKRKWVGVFSKLVSSKTMSARYQEIWDMTFGTVVHEVPVEISADAAQPGLFDSNPSNGISGTLEPIGNPSGTVTMHDSADRVISGTSEPIGNPSGTHREPRSNLILSNLDLPEEDPDGRPRSTPRLVPPLGPEGLTVDAVCKALEASSGGRVACRIIDHRIGPRLWETVEALGRSDLGLEDVELAGEWLAAGGLHYRDDLDAAWVAKAGNLLGAIQAAIKWEVGGRPELQAAKRGGNEARDPAALEAFERIKEWVADSCPRDDTLPPARDIRALKECGGVAEMKSTTNGEMWISRFCRAYAKG